MPPATSVSSSKKRKCEENDTFELLKRQVDSLDEIKALLEAREMREKALHDMTYVNLFMMNKKLQCELKERYGIEIADTEIVEQ